MKYRKKPVVIDAFQWWGEEVPGWDIVSGNGKSWLMIHTLEGDMKASLGDYIITGVAGETYPCKPDIFERTYEKI